MSSQVTRQLTVNITVTNTWTQFKDIATGLAYAVGAGNRGDISWIHTANYGANDAVVEVALSVDGTITDNERLEPPITLAQYEQRVDNSGYVAPATYGLWGRATGTTPNVTYQAYVLEITP